MTCVTRLPRISRADEPGLALEGRVHLEEHVVARCALRVEHDAVVGEALRHVAEQRLQLLLAALERVADAARLGALEHLPAAAVAHQREAVILHDAHDVRGAELRPRVQHGRDDVEPSNGLGEEGQRRARGGGRRVQHQPEAVEAGKDRLVEPPLDRLVQPPPFGRFRRRRDPDLPESRELRERGHGPDEQARRLLHGHRRADLPPAELVAGEARGEEGREQLRQVLLRIVEDAEVAAPRQLTR